MALQQARAGNAGSLGLYSLVSCELVLSCELLRRMARGRTLLRRRPREAAAAAAASGWPLTRRPEVAGLGWLGARCRWFGRRVSGSEMVGSGSGWAGSRVRGALTSPGLAAGEQLGGAQLSSPAAAAPKSSRAAPADFLCARWPQLCACGRS